MEQAKEGFLHRHLYSFLPYQPRLSERGLDYATIHELQAFREPGCDQTVADMRSAHWDQAERT